MTNSEIRSLASLALHAAHVAIQNRSGCAASEVARMVKTSSSGVDAALEQFGMTVIDVQCMFDDAVNAGCKLIQDRLGVVAGDTAGLIFADESELPSACASIDMFEAYIRAEIASVQAAKAV